MKLDIDALWLISYSNDLARKFKNGIVPLSESTKEDLKDKIVYDDRTSVDLGYYALGYNIVLDYSGDPLNCDDVKYYEHKKLYDKDGEHNSYLFLLRREPGDEPGEPGEIWIQCELNDDCDCYIVIDQDGWKMCW